MNADKPTATVIPPPSDGGPAFPRAGVYRRSEGNYGHRHDVTIQEPQDGMSVRTYIATKVYAAMIEQDRYINDGAAAEAAVRKADALIRALKGGA